MKDRNDNFYEEVGNIRITYVREESRKKGKNWSKSDVLRFNVYDDKQKLIQPGAEYQINNSDDILNLIRSIISVSS